MFMSVKLAVSWRLNRNLIKCVFGTVFRMWRWMPVDDWPFKLSELATVNRHPTLRTSHDFLLVYKRENTTIGNTKKTDWLAEIISHNLPDTGKWTVSFDENKHLLKYEEGRGGTETKPSHNEHPSYMFQVKGHLLGLPALKPALLTFSRVLPPSAKFSSVKYS